DLVADRAQERLHAEIGTLRGATRRQASGILFVERVLAYLIRDNVERHRLGRAVSVRFLVIVPVCSSVFANSVPTKGISGNSVMLNQSAPLRSLSRGADCVCRSVLMVTVNLLAATFSGSKLKFPLKLSE